MLFQSYINNLLKNLPKRDKPIVIDLVMDGGLFNGSYLIGCLYFLKALEKINYVKIKRISGCSVGAAVGLLYTLDKLNVSQKINNSVIKELKRTNKISVIKNFKRLIFEDKVLTEKESKIILEKVNNYLYVSYHKKSKKRVCFKKITKHKYRTIDELFDYILRSCFVPYLIDGNMLYKNKYIDGLTPYIFDFKNNRKILYLNLCDSDKLLYMIHIKNEKSDYHRILTGLLDIHLFFIKNTNTSICSYVNNWTIKNKCNNQYRKYIFEYIVISILSFAIYFNKNYISKTKSKEIQFVIKIGKDIIIYFYKYILKKCIK